MGECFIIKKGINTSDANATSTTILPTYSAYVNGIKINGNMNVVVPTFSDIKVSDEISVGNYTSGDSNKYLYLKAQWNSYYSGVNWLGYKENNLLPQNIKQGVSIFGVNGSLPEGRRYASGTSATHITNQTVLFSTTIGTSETTYTTGRIFRVTTPFAPSIIRMYITTQNSESTLRGELHITSKAINWLATAGSTNCTYVYLANKPNLINGTTIDFPYPWGINVSTYFWECWE